MNGWIFFIIQHATILINAWDPVWTIAHFKNEPDASSLPDPVIITSEILRKT